MVFSFKKKLLFGCYMINDQYILNINCSLSRLALKSCPAEWFGERVSGLCFPFKACVR